MTQVFLTTGGTKPWPTPSDWINANNSVELIGCGGNGALGASVYPGPGGGGGGGGAYRKRINLTLSGDNPWRVGNSTSAVTTRFGNDGTTGTNFFGAQFGTVGLVPGGHNHDGHGRGGSAAEETGGTPPGLSPAGFAGGNGGGSGKSSSGGGGGGSAGPSGPGKAGGTSKSTSNGGGGGGANGGSSTVGDNSTANSAANGGNGTGGTGGGIGLAGAGIGGGGSLGGGGGSCGQTPQVFIYIGGKGGSDAAFDSTHGCGGGGGSTGVDERNTSPVHGGAGGLYGGGGAGCGWSHGVPTDMVVGPGGDGLIVITYPAS